MEEFGPDLLYGLPTNPKGAIIISYTNAHSISGLTFRFLT